jgi:hypothetical protein
MPDGTFDSASYTAGDTSAHKLSAMTPSPAGNVLKSVQGCVIKAHKANTGIVWVGKDANVAANAGYPLDPGESLPMDILNPGNLWILQSVGADRFSIASIRP